MASVQERLQLNRTPLDKWTSREQLCLASAVSCSGDQNWMSVSRTMKFVCGHINRPADWYSQKSCAVQYGHLLENVETPKRKKRSSEGNTRVASPAAVETPTDLILRRLTEQRIQELKTVIHQEQEEYAKIYRELKSMEAGQLTESQLLEMWRDIEKHQESQRIDEMKMENQMREREQRKIEMQRSWRASMGTASTTAAAQQQKTSADTTSIDMDVEEIIGTGKPVLSSLSGAANYNQQNQQQQQQQQQTATSPLLSSLLKSPTSSVAPTGLPTNSIAVAGSASARATAPTITTLLTSGSIPNSNQPAITLKSNIMPPNEAAQLLARPISGPPTETTSVVSGAGQSLLSPSQSAPTLSMLLEKNKSLTANNANQIVSTNAEPKANEGSGSGNGSGSAVLKSESENAADSNNEEVPMDIEEELGGTCAYIGAGDSDEPDPNEEQQLLEVFKNIGNIDELDIDVAAVIDDGGVDFLKGVDDEPPHDANDDMDFDNKIDTHAAISLARTTSPKRQTKSDLQEAVKQDDHDKKHVKMELLHVEKLVTKTEKLSGATKVETISSDDSNDNLPLAAVASLENKERNQNMEASTSEKTFLKEKVESALKNEDSDASVSNETKVSDVPIVAEQEEVLNENHKISGTVLDQTVVAASGLNNTCEQQKSPTESDNSDVIVIPTDDDDDDSNGEKLGIKDEESNATKPNSAVESKNETNTEEKLQSKETDIVNEHEDVKSERPDHYVTDEQSIAAQTYTSATENEQRIRPAPIISIDTDDSSTMDTNSSVRGSDKTLSASVKITSQLQISLPRKNYLSDARDPKLEQEDTSSLNPTASTTAPSAVPTARTPILRKLRDRDRSESPMIDDESMASEHSTSMNQRSRRRYSSTPLLDSIPNSPASSDRDERETRISKKVLLSIYNALQPSKHAALFQRANSEDHIPKYDEVCLRPLDWQTIKKNIENGSIRSVSELQRDVMLLSQNSLMVFKTNSADYKATLTFLQESQVMREFAGSAHIGELSNKGEKDIKEKEGKTVGGSTAGLNITNVKVRMGSRKSQRIS